MTTPLFQKDYRGRAIGGPYDKMLLRGKGRLMNVRNNAVPITFSVYEHVRFEGPDREIVGFWMHDSVPASEWERRVTETASQPVA